MSTSSSSDPDPKLGQGSPIYGRSPGYPSVPMEPSAKRSIGPQLAGGLKHPDQQPAGPQVSMPMSGAAVEPALQTHTNVTVENKTANAIPRTGWQVGSQPEQGTAPGDLGPPHPPPATSIQRAGLTLTRPQQKVSLHNGKLTVDATQNDESDGDSGSDIENDFEEEPGHDFSAEDFDHPGLRHETGHRPNIQSENENKTEPFTEPEAEPETDNERDEPDKEDKHDKYEPDEHDKEDKPDDNDE